MPGQHIVVASSEAWPEAGAQAERSLNTGWILDNTSFTSTGGVVSNASPSTAVAFLSTGDGTTGSGNGFYALNRRMRVVHAGGTAYGYVSAASLAGGQTTVTMTFQGGGTTSLSTASITSAAVGPLYGGVTGNYLGGLESIAETVLSASAASISATLCHSVPLCMPATPCASPSVLDTRCRRSRAAS